jgi:hypothetical protein
MSNEKDNLEVGLKAFAGLLDEFRKGNIANKKAARQSLEQNMAELFRRWNEQFPGFPRSIPYLSYIGLSRREPRNRHLNRIIIQQLKSEEPVHGDRVVVNPACFLGQRARYLASRLKSFKIIATDINPLFNSWYKHFCKTPDNYEFLQDSIFNPSLEVRPAAVVFFGACGSVTDAAMDYFIKTDSPYLFCRTCCQHIIGGNIELAKGFSIVNWLWGLPRPIFVRRLKENKGHYFSPDYSMGRYPRSQAAKGLTNSDEFLEISRNSAGSGICRTIIDLDRYLYLAEHGYNVWYRAEMFVAEKL